MKVLHLTTHLNTGGITTYIETLGRILTNNGCSVSVASSGGEKVQNLEEAGIKCHRLNIRTKSELSPKVYRSIPEVIELIKKERFDLIHSHTRITHVLATWAKLFTGVPHVSTCHGFYKRRLGRRILPAWGDYIIAISGAVGEHLKAYFKEDESKICVVHNAVDIERFLREHRSVDAAQAKKDLGLHNETLVIASVARLVKDKGHNYLIRSIPKILRQFPNLRLFIVGEGPYRKELEKTIKQLHLEHYVTLTGATQDVVKYLAITDIFVLPAIWREGFGLSMIEAMCLKKPVIVTDICALNTIITNDINGIMIPPKSEDSIASAICDMLRDTELRKRIGDGGYDFVCENFSLPRMKDEILAVYKKAIKKQESTNTGK